MTQTLMSNLLGTYGKKAIVTVFTVSVSAVLAVFNKALGWGLKPEEVLGPAVGGAIYTVMQGLSDIFTGGMTSSVAKEKAKDAAPPPDDSEFDK